MKKIKYLALSFVFILFTTSCDKEDDTTDTSPTVNFSDLIGTWQMTDYNIPNGRYETTQQGQTFIATFTQQGSNFDYNITFSQNPNIITGQGSYSVTSMATILGQTATSTDDASASSLNGDSTWMLEGNIITTTDEAGITVKYEVIEIKGGTLKLKADLNQGAIEDSTGLTNGIAIDDVSGSLYITCFKTTR